MRRFQMAWESVAVSVMAGTALVAVLVVWAGAELAAAAAGAAEPAPNPLTFVDDVLARKFVWVRADTAWTALVAGAVVALAAVCAAVWAKRSPEHYVDRRARHLRRDPVGVRRYVDWKNGPGSATGGPGPELGVDVVGHKTVRATWECVAVVVAGARMRKTSQWVMPHVLSAPGAVFTTSNKRDVVDYTRALRSIKGRTWVFDPQSIYGAEPTWWWNPLDLAADIPGALMLAGIFAAATRPIGSTMDSYFDPEGEALLGFLLLGANRAGLSVRDVYKWVNDPRDPAAARALMAAEFEMAAAGVKGTSELPDRQRAGVYGTAKKMVQWVVDDQLARWCSDPGGTRRRFAAAEFVTSSDTVYGLSREGPGSAGPLTAAFTAAVAQAAEKVAAANPGGRLAVPLVMVLDEVANVCRWRELPDLYSHYGSRGIFLESLLQSWSQGVECFGEQGMNKLWSAANVGLYAGGATETRYLQMLSDLSGEVDLVTQGVSEGRLGTSRSQSFRRERVFDVAALGAFPTGRAFVTLSGAPPMVVRARSVWDTDLGDAIRGVVPATALPEGVRGSKPRLPTARPHPVAVGA